MNTTDHNAAQNAEALREKLNRAVEETVMLKGNSVDDIRFFTRNRKLPMGVLVKFLLTATGGPLNREIFDAGLNIASSSFIERRRDISHACLHDLLLRFNELCGDRATATMKDKRLWAIDGSTVPLPRNPNSKNHYKSDSNAKGWNNIHANLLYSLSDKTYVDCYVGEGDSRRSHDEQGALYSLIYKRQINQPTILVLDRGYESYSCLAHLNNLPRLFYVLRVKNDGLRPVKPLPMEELDRDLEWVITTRQTNEAKENNWIFLQTGSKKGKTNSPNTRIARWDFGHIDPYPMKCRAVRLKLPTGELETLLTNLPREEFSMSELKEIYRMRWQIETSIRFWKYAVGALAVHSKTDQFILQELYAHLTMYNFCQRIFREIEIPQKPGNKYRYEIDQTMGIYLCKKFFREPGFTGEKLVQDIKRYVCPVRPGRADERNIKVKPATPFPYRIPS